MTDEQRAKRLHHHMYETCEGIAEHAERIVRLEEENEKLRKVAKDMYPSYCYANGGNGETYLTYEQDADIRDRVRELGVLDE